MLSVSFILVLPLVAVVSGSQQPGSVSVASTNGVRADTKAPASPYGPLKAPGYCIPPAVVETRPAGVPIAKLPDGSKPNFIIILTDDQGWDDWGVNNPWYVHTPNLDRFMNRATRFDNFYVTPQCAQSRAALLTGRMPARVGTMLVHGGYDFINSKEATSAEVLGAAGYNSVHYGKWHNGRTLGYEPWHVGFNDSYLPPMASAMNTSGIVSHNGSYELTSSQFLDEALMENVLEYLNRTEKNSTKPFYMYYAPHSIHTSRTDGPFQGSAFRLFPQQYRERYNDSRYANIAKSTIDAWAMLEYLDDVLGRLFDYLDNSPLGQNTYVMIMSDNGPQLLTDERRFQERRIPSKMQGSKSLPDEAGIRNFLAVSGPGVQGGVVDSTLLHLIDILPTMADLADIPESAGNHKPWEGISFKNLLLPDANITSMKAALPGQQIVSTRQSNGIVEQSSRRGQLLTNSKQYNRFVIALSPHCWDSDAVPELDANREIIRPQPLLDFDTGGVPNTVYWGLLKGLKAEHPGFQACIVVRHREYKWVGSTGKVYRFTGESHVELPCNEVAEPQASALAQIMSTAARNWWQSIVMNETSSFTKPVYYMGIGNMLVTNMLADGAHERTPGNISLLANGARGFKSVGDRMCYNIQVFKEGTYDVSLFYTSKQWAVFKLSMGPYQAIINGTAPSVTATLPVMGKMEGSSMGWLNLTVSAPNEKPEACLELVSAQYPGNAVFDNLSNIRITRLGTLTVMNLQSQSSSYTPEVSDFGEGEEEAYIDPGSMAANPVTARNYTAGVDGAATRVAPALPAPMQVAAAQQQAQPAGISSHKVAPRAGAKPVTKPAATNVAAAPKEPAAVVKKPAAAPNLSPAAAAVNKPASGPTKKPAAAAGIAKHPPSSQQLQQQRQEPKPVPKSPAKQQQASMHTAAPSSTSKDAVAIAAAASVSVSEAKDNEIIAVPKGRRGRSSSTAQAPIAFASVPNVLVKTPHPSEPTHTLPGTPVHAQSRPALIPPADLDTKGAPVAQPAPMALTPENLGQYQWMFADGIKASEQESGGRQDMSSVIAALRERYHWPKGQGMMESMFSPYDAEDISSCEACKPNV